MEEERKSLVDLEGREHPYLGRLAGDGLRYRPLKTLLGIKED